MTIYLCRHGQTTGDVEDRYGGDYEDHLTAVGISQAGDLAAKMQGSGVEIIFTSPRIRARETSQILSTAWGVPVRVVEDFRERNHYGILSGLTKSECRIKFPKEVEQLKDYRLAVTGAESYSPFGIRVASALQTLENLDFDTVCVVTHGGPIRFIFREILFFGEVDIADCAFAKLHWDGIRLSVGELNGIVKK